MPSFAERIARHHDRPVEAACAVRPPNTILFGALAAGIGAGIGSAVGGTLVVAAGGGLGFLVGYLLRWLTLRGSGQALAMALVVGPEQLDLLAMNGFGTRPTRTIRTIPYADVRGIELRNRIVLEVRIAILTAEEKLTFDGGKHGVGAAPPAIEALRLRIGSGTAAR